MSMTAADAALEWVVITNAMNYPDDPVWEEVQSTWLTQPAVQAVWDWRQARRQAGLAADLAALLADRGPDGLRVLEYMGQGPAVFDAPALVVAALRQAAERRRVIAILRAGVAQAEAEAEVGTGEATAAQTVLDALSAELVQRTADMGTDGPALATAHLQWATHMIDGVAPQVGLSTGFRTLDHYWTGVYPGELIVLAGRPAMGKSTLLLNLVREWVGRQHKTVAYWSLEMGEHLLNLALTAQMTGLDSQVLVQPRWSAAVSGAVLEAAAQREHWAWRVFTRCRGIGDITAGARRLKARGALDVVVVDYLQRIPLEPARHDTRTDAIGAVTAALKGIAEELACPVVLVSSLNRQSEQRMEQRPELADLRGSGDIEHDADKVLFLYRDPRAVTSGDGTGHSVGLHFAKGRFGAKLGTDRLMLWPVSGRMADLSAEERRRAEE